MNQKWLNLACQPTPVVSVSAISTSSARSGCTLRYVWRLTSRLLDKIRTGTFVALVLCVVLLVFMPMVIPNGETMWADKQWAADQIGNAKTPDQLRQILQFAASSTSGGQHTWRECLYAFMLANMAMIAFLSRHLFLIHRLQTAVSNDQKT